MRYPEWANEADRTSIAKVRRFNYGCIAFLALMVVWGVYWLTVAGPRFWLVVGTVAPLGSIYLIHHGYLAFIERLELQRACTSLEEITVISRIPLVLHTLLSAFGQDPYLLYKASQRVPRKRPLPPRYRPTEWGQHPPPPPPPRRKRPPPPNYDDERPPPPPDDDELPRGPPPMPKKK